MFTCQQCNQTSYNPYISQASCLPCRNDTVTTFLGATSDSDCLCAAGFYSPTLTPGGDCEECPYGAVCTG